MNCQVLFQILQENFKVGVVSWSQMDTFESVLTEYIRDQERSVSAFARRMEISHTAVNNVLNGQKATAEFVIDAAKAMGQDPVAMLRLAGYLPSLSPAEGMVEALLHEWNNIESKDRPFVLRVLRGLRVTGYSSDGGVSTPLPAAYEGPSREGRGEETDVSQLLGKATLRLDNPYRIAYEVLCEQCTEEQRHAMIIRLAELAASNEIGQPDVEKPEPDTGPIRRVRAVSRGSQRASETDG
jgi:hypothetical protein